MFGGDAVADAGVGMGGLVVECFPSLAAFVEPSLVGVGFAPVGLGMMGPVKVFVGVTIVDAGFDFAVGAGGEVKFAGEGAGVVGGGVAEDFREEKFVGGNLLAVLAAASGARVADR